MKAREQFLALLTQALPLIMEMAAEDSAAKARAMRTHGRACGRRELLRLIVETTAERRDLTPEDAPRMVAVVEAIAKEVEGAFADAMFEEDVAEIYADVEKVAAQHAATERPPMSAAEAG